MLSSECGPGSGLAGLTYMAGIHARVTKTTLAPPDEPTRALAGWLLRRARPRLSSSARASLQ